jgi:hypothetical protein
MRTKRNINMMPNPDRLVVGGVDTHKDEHVAAIIDTAGVSSASRHSKQH